jgi:hypothetical protein
LKVVLIRANVVFLLDYPREGRALIRRHQCSDGLKPLKSALAELHALLHDCMVVSGVFRLQVSD